MTLVLVDEQLDCQKQPHDHNLYILDLRMGHFGADAQTPVLVDELLGFQKHPHDHHLYILNLKMGHFGTATQTHYFWFPKATTVPQFIYI